MFGYDHQEGIYLQHASAESIKRLVGDEVFSRYYKFTIVRNPYARSISVYHYLKKHHDRQFKSFEKYIKKLPELVSRPNLTRGSHHIAQINYTHIDRRCICDQIAHFESLPHSLVPVRNILGIEKPQGKYNYRQQQPWKILHVGDFYTEEMIVIMQKIYADDFEAFGYSHNPREV